MNALPKHARRVDITDAANSFATDILCLPGNYTQAKKMLAAVGQALNSKQRPTDAERQRAWLAWRKVRDLGVPRDYALEVDRLYQLYQLSEAEFRDEIMKVMAVRWAKREWRMRR